MLARKTVAPRKPHAWRGTKDSAVVVWQSGKVWREGFQKIGGAAHASLPVIPRIAVALVDTTKHQ